VNIDPRMLKDLMQLQLLSKMNLITSGESENLSSSDNGLDFSDMLQALMDQADPVKAPSQPVKRSASAFSLNGTSLPHHSLSKPASFDPLIREASERYGVDPSLVKAVIHQESSFNPYAVSRAGAKGLMQLMDDTGEGYGVTDPFDPQQNIRAGTQFLSSLLRKYNGNEGVALAAYNAGPGHVDRLGIRDDNDLLNKFHLLPEETQAYVRKVLDLKQSYS
jgi:soluble lytic murein transglycosylase-like protein